MAEAADAKFTTKSAHAGGAEELDGSLLPGYGREEESGTTPHNPRLSDGVKGRKVRILPTLYVTYLICRGQSIRKTIDAALQPKRLEWALQKVPHRA